MIGVLKIVLPVPRNVWSLVKKALLALALLGGAAMTAGCAATSSAAVSAPPTAASPSAAATSQASASAAPSPAGAAPAGGPTACTAADLTGSIGQVGTGQNDQHYVGLQLTNTGSAPCTLHGYPGVSWLTDASGGTQVGAAAERDVPMGGGDGTAVTLAPGALASAQLDIIGTGDFPAAQCKPAAVAGLRVYPPGATDALFIKDPGQACSGTMSAAQLVVGYVQAGAQPPN